MVYPPRRVKAVTFAAEKRGVSKGMLGGIVMMVIAAVWFFVALAAGIIFFYPPVLCALCGECRRRAVLILRLSSSRLCRSGGAKAGK